MGITTSLPILTVVYHETLEHFNMGVHCWNSMTPHAITAVVNRRYLKGKYPTDIKYIDNFENCLAGAWNIGLRELFKENDYVCVANLDLMAPSALMLQKLVGLLQNNPEYGVIAPTPRGFGEPMHQRTDDKLVDVTHGDGSFSCFIISKKAFEDVGEFDTNFKPAYFEDNDYLERLWAKGYKPKRSPSITYTHLGQGTVKYGQQVRTAYPAFMHKNFEYYKSKWGKVPDHLSEDAF